MTSFPEADLSNVPPLLSGASLSLSH